VGRDVEDVGLSLFKVNVLETLRKKTKNTEG